MLLEAVLYRKTIATSPSLLNVRSLFYLDVALPYLCILIAVVTTTASTAYRTADAAVVGPLNPAALELLDAAMNGSVIGIYATNSQGHVSFSSSASLVSELI